MAGKASISFLSDSVRTEFSLGISTQSHRDTEVHFFHCAAAFLVEDKGRLTCACGGWCLARAGPSCCIGNNDAELCAAAERLTLHFFQPARFQHGEKRETTLGLDQVELKLRWLRLKPSLLIMRFGARASSVGEKI